tara:strand:- start:473 stop:760 length:288 start_codon:yes stop_codon:yes gene_type:complete
MSTKDQRTVNETVEADTPMKEWLVNYVGEQHEPGDDQVTVEMIVETMAKEFPEFVLALAEENWIRGYQQALDDITEGEKLYKQELAKAEDENSEE